MNSMPCRLVNSDSLADFGEVDATTAGHTCYVTKLAISDEWNLPRALKVTVIQKGFLWRHADTFYWLLDDGHLANLRADLKRAFRALEGRETAPVRGNFLFKFLGWLQGFRFVSDLGAMTLTDGTSRSRGFVGEKRGVQFLLVVATRGGRTVCHPIPSTALRVIIEKIEQFCDKTTD